MDTNRRMIFMRKNPGKYRKWYSVFCTLLLQTYWEMDGTPMISTQWFTRSK